MRFSSTIDSAKSGETTILAIIETSLAILISIFIAIRFDTLLHIIIGSCIAPFLLLRSPESTEYGKRLFEPKKKNLRQDEWSESDFFQSMGGELTNLILWAFIIRIFATVRYFKLGFKFILHNWSRVTFCTDMFTPFELVPGSGPITDVLLRNLGTFISLLLGGIFLAVICSILFLIGIFSATDKQALIIILVLGAVLSGGFLMMGVAGGTGVLCFLIPFAYRFSLKSTAYIWYPLIFVLKPSFPEKFSLIDKLEEIQELGLEKISRFLAWYNFFQFILKMIFFPYLVDKWNTFIFAPFFNIWFKPYEMHPWHIATFINACTVLGGYYFYIDKAPRRLRTGDFDEKAVERNLYRLLLVRKIICAYTIPIGIYFAFAAACNIKIRLLEFSWKWYPW
jgi:hypothetical protein